MISASVLSLGEYLRIWAERPEPTGKIRAEYSAQLARWCLGLDADAFGLRVVCRCASGHAFALPMRGGLAVTPANDTNPAEPLEQPTPSREASRQVAQAFGGVLVAVHQLRTLPDTVTRRLDSMDEVEIARRQQVAIEMPDGEEVTP
jgi:hypothetical protein